MNLNDIPEIVLSALTVLDGETDDYGKGYKDALESTALAMHRAGVGEVVILEVVLTALDAMDNNA